MDMRLLLVRGDIGEAKSVPSTCAVAAAGGSPGCVSGQKPAEDIKNQTGQCRLPHSRRGIYAQGAERNFSAAVTPTASPSPLPAVGDGTARGVSHCRKSTSREKAMPETN